MEELKSKVNLLFQHQLIEVFLHYQMNQLQYLLSLKVRLFLTLLKKLYLPTKINLLLDLIFISIKTSTASIKLSLRLSKSPKSLKYTLLVNSR